MARGRVYRAVFQNIAVTAVQDLISLTATAGMVFCVHEVWVGQITQTTVANLNMSLKILPATVTAGSGGAAVTPSAMLRGDAASTVTSRRNDTTQATTSGTAIVARADVINPINGYQYLPPVEDRPVIKLSEAFVVSLDTAPGASMNVSGGIVFEELF